MNAVAQSWNLTGNAGTTPPANFIGTTDASVFVIKVNNQQSGYIDYLNTNAANVALGYQSLINIFGSKGGNSAIGYQCLYKNTSGAYNTATGQFAMYSNTTGSSNVASGVRALYSNTTGAFNTALGNRAMYLNTTAGSNTAIGNRAMYNNTAGYSNVAIGVDALNMNTSGKHVVAIGDSAMYASTGGILADVTAVGSKTLYNNTGAENTAIGAYALYQNTFSPENTAVGAYSLFSNTTYGLRNTAVGTRSLYSNTTGQLNTAVGVFALYSSTTAYYNTAVGTGALENTTTGNYNTAIGEGSGGGNVSGSFNSIVGFSAGMYYPGSLNNITALGYSALATANNQVRIGNTSVTSIGGQVGWTNFSDARVKKNIKENVPGLRFINLLKPVTYNYDLAKEYALLGRADSSNYAEKNDIEKINFTGFVAQQVDAAANQIGYDFSGVDKSGKIWGLRYSEFVVPLVKAVQELSNDNEQLKMNNDAMKSEIGNLKSENTELKTRLDKIEAMLAVNASTQNNTSLSTVNGQRLTASLSQNIPNPFTGVATINCYVPVNNGNVYINVYSQTGSLVKSIKINNEGKNTVTLNANEFAAGTYKYALVTDGKIIDSRMMVIQR